jgi:hypothetical protein
MSGRYTLTLVTDTSTAARHFRDRLFRYAKLLCRPQESRGAGRREGLSSILSVLEAGLPQS